MDLFNIFFHLMNCHCVRQATVMTEQKMKMKKELKKPELTAEEAVVHVQVCFNLSVGKFMKQYRYLMFSSK